LPTKAAVTVASDETFELVHARLAASFELWNSGGAFLDTAIKERVHPGWFVLFAGLVGVFMTTPGQTVGVAPFVDHIASDLALPREQILLLYSLGTLLGILPAPLIGRLVDRFGPRRAIPIIVLVVAAACLALASVQGPATLAAAFTLLRGSAIGGLSLVSGHMINLWFDRYRGRANAVSMMGLAFGGLLVPGLAEQITDAFGWRVAYIALGAGVLAIMLPVGMVFFRNRPQTYGALPDFGRTSTERAKEIAGGLQVAEALRTPMLWYFLAIAVIVNAVGTALLLDHLRVLGAAGIERGVAISLLGVVTLTQAVSVLGGGVLVDRYGTRRIGLLGLVFTALAVACVMLAPSLLAGWLYAVLLGASLGILYVVQGAAVAEHFGTRALGTLRGIVFVVGICGAAAGPLAFAWWSPETGYVIFFALVAAAVLIGSFAPAPRWR
jgi:MFS family permease